MTITVYTPYGFIGATGSTRDENDYLEWSISTNYGLGFTFYMLNNTEKIDLFALPRIERTPGNFAYTALLSNQQASASGIFYPPYLDKWWFVIINHYNGTACSVDFFDYWNGVFISVDEPINSRSWEVNTAQYIKWTSTGSISNVIIELYNINAFVMEITPSTPNDGEYNWAILSGLDGSELYQIKISDISDPSVYDFSDYFEIMRPPSGIPGYNLYILIGIICVISVILVKRRILK